MFTANADHGLQLAKEHRAAQIQAAQDRRQAKEARRYEAPQPSRMGQPLGAFASLFGYRAPTSKRATV